VPERRLDQSAVQLRDHNNIQHLCIEPDTNHTTMSKIAQIDGRSAAVAWSPLATHADVLAIGTKVSLPQYF
jgi:hypothetical protein